MKKRYTTIADIGMLSLAQFRRRNAAFVGSNLTSAEKKYLLHKPLQSAAGIVAAKLALVSLFRKLGAKMNVSGKDFHIGHTPDGAPRVMKISKKLPENMALGDFRVMISISHNRTHACAVAAVECATAALR